MEWYWVLVLVLTILFAFFASGMQVAIVFLMINIIGWYFLIGGWNALTMLPGSMINIIANFVMAAIPLFILMGSALFHSGVARLLLDAVEKWIGAVPGRLALVCVFGAAGFGALSGSASATTATLGATLAPEMRARGYGPELSVGPIIGSGGLAMIIPPSGLAILLGALANISIGRLLIAGLLPGILIAIGYAVMIIVRVRINPNLAPTEQYIPPTWGERFHTFRLILPAGFLVFLVLGLILFGVATPAESAALGALGAFIVGALYGKMNWQVMRATVEDTIKATSAIFLIISAAAGFSQVLSFTGVTGAVVQTVTYFDLTPFWTVAMMMVLLVILGMFMDQVAMMLITLPVFMPIVHTLGLDPVWFGIIMLINLQVGNETPPFGSQLYIGAAFMPGFSSGQIIRAVIPFILVDLSAILLLLLVPDIALWLPNLMFGE